MPSYPGGSIGKGRATTVDLYSVQALGAIIFIESYKSNVRNDRCPQCDPQKEKKCQNSL